MTAVVHIQPACSHDSRVTYAHNDTVVDVLTYYVCMCLSITPKPRFFITPTSADVAGGGYAPGRLAHQGI